ncbi:antirestriction protein ArdA [Janibacter sp. CX7]|uniref:antirestriction protein ArdA n=1 Tax=Janibacter sp. CX7 TaxID=2963431 RepID=UPI0020CDB71B|nr:antirestriction protein ArdA [Janibacter sp. CX7]UTT65235.1 antirestriction protein ArdA [Janibacter sp. CX7]
MNTITATTPRVWIGCLACYNDGRLVGEWFAAEGAEDITLEEVHAHAGGVRWGCEELWVMDTDGLPISREMSPAEAGEWSALLAEVDEWQRDALAAWVASGDYIAEGRGDLPSLPDFEERYAGEWDTFEDYAAELFDDLGYGAEMPEHLAP